MMKEKFHFNLEYRVKNKYLRLFASCLTALGLKYLVAIYFAYDNMSEPNQVLLAWFLFMFFFAIPTYIFMVVQINKWLTPLENKSDNNLTFAATTIAIVLTLAVAGFLYFLSTQNI